MENPNGKSAGNRQEESIYEFISTNSTKKCYKTLFDHLKTTSKILGVDQCFYTFDLADVLWKVQLWKQYMPNVHSYYAVKTNLDRTLLRFLSLLGFSFECGSKGEIQMIIEAGNEPENIVFAHVIKTPRDLKYAKNVGIGLLTFDSEAELLKIKENYSTARLLLRIAPKEMCKFDKINKFGCDVNEALSLLKVAKGLNLNLVGVCFHVGGLCRGTAIYEETIRSSRQVFNAAKELGFQFDILDIGGGFVGEKGSEELFIETAQVIQSALKEYFSDVKVEIIAEPGTFVVGSAVTVTTAICGVKKRNPNNKKNGVERYYYLNDGMFGSFFKGVEKYGYKVEPLLNESELSQRNFYRSRLWGQTCASIDLVLGQCILPDMQEEELLVWDNMGAYALDRYTTFCGTPLPVKRHVFINNNKLDMEWSRNPEVVNFLRKECSFIENET